MVSIYKDNHCIIFCETFRVNQEIHVILVEFYFLLETGLCSILVGNESVLLNRIKYIQALHIQIKKIYTVEMSIAV